MRSRFDEELGMLHSRLIAMGASCEKVIGLSSEALKDMDRDKALLVVSLGKKIDASEHEIENLCMRLLLEQQPVAGDLRLISSALKMVTDMERIGDQAEDISEIVAGIDHKSGHEIRLICNMAEAAGKMVTESVDAFVKRSLDIARKVIRDDDVVDDFFVEVRDMLIAVINSNPGEGAYALDLLMIAKYLERIGDHAVNIADAVIYSITGEIREKENEGMVR